MKDLTRGKDIRKINNEKRKQEEIKEIREVWRKRGARGSLVVKALGYKLEGCGFETQ
jgi:hypothetical protein